MAVTIKDIARRAGVDHTTVSRALHGSPLISAEVTRRIHQIAAEMGYLPSAAARSLKTRRSRVLGVVISHIADPFFSEVLQGVDNVASRPATACLLPQPSTSLRASRPSSAPCASTASTG